MEKLLARITRLEKRLGLKADGGRKKAAKAEADGEEKRLRLAEKKLDAILKALATTSGPRKTAKPAQNAPDTNWKTVGESAVGLAHRRGVTPVPCQDAHAVIHKKRLIMAVCDGAGSAALSEIGAKTVSAAAVRFLSSLEPLASVLLDLGVKTLPEALLAETLYRHAVGQIRDLAAELKRPGTDFKTTLLLFATGTRYGFWFRVGDGEIVGERKGRLFRIGAPVKGEYSNETVFVDEKYDFSKARYGLIQTEDLSGIALMTDGAAERLVSYDGKRIAGRLSTYFAELKKDRLPREDLYKFFTDLEIWTGSTQDDKTLVLGARA
ncbi:MAG: protein phosphatase 2C domain-containing protein [Fusobacteriaceae bacterium]|jgi:hypothetical protein|nr:protein phosphatase 2C domain-containing protein [Fusobacteriaceae bacterium]